MSDEITYRPLTDRERKALIGQGCTTEDWHGVQVEEGFDPARIQNVHFAGQVRIGRLSGTVATGGIEKTAGLYNAYVADCTIGRGVRIANIAVHIANYQIADGVSIEDVGVMETRPGASFGNGVEVEVLNESGGRTVILFNELCSQFAYLMCLHRYRSRLTEQLTAIARAYASGVVSDAGSVGPGATIRGVKEIVDVNIGPQATIGGAARLTNGTVLSGPDAPSTVGHGVHAEDFIIAEGSIVAGGAMLARTFVGQGCQVGKQFSSENSLFFANCEAFHGEAVSVFAGPYTVTHHKSTLLIAGLFSFFNAGSGTNQSNHMYKLGPVHEGKLERGSKTGSFAYVMWPCRVGPFSVVLGKHTRLFDTADLPFSFIDASPEGRCRLAPGLNLATVGTVRDGAKWPTRDRREGKVKRDQISFDVFSPFTVGRMLKGMDLLEDLQQKTESGADSISIRGAEVRRALLRTGQKYYRYGIEMYLREKVVERAERAIAASKPLTDRFATENAAVYSEDWLDIGGQLMARSRLEDLAEAVASGAVTRVDQFHAQLDRIAQAYGEDEWAWVKNAYQRVFDRDLGGATEDDVVACAQSLLAVRTKFLKLVLTDAQKEFDDRTRTGFGQDGVQDDAERDFIEVRGTYDGDPFVQQAREEIASLEQRVDELKQKLTKV